MVEAQARALHPLFVSGALPGDHMVSVHYLRPPRPSRSWSIDAADTRSGARRLTVAVSGDVNADGRGDLVLGEESDAGGDRIEVYSLDGEHAADRIATVPAFGGTGVSSSGNLLVGDVDPTEAGDEIIVGEDGRGRRASRIRIFGGLAAGELRLLWKVRVINTRAARREPVQFALGAVAPEEHRGVRLVVADPRGFVLVYGLTSKGMVRLWRAYVLPSAADPSTRTLAVGDLIPALPGDEVAIGDAGPRDGGRVRVLDGRDGTMVAEFEVFAPGTAPSGVELWIADVIDSLAGSELLVGQGLAGGQLRVLSLATGVARPLFDFPNESARTAVAHRHLAIGDLVPNLPGNEVAIAQDDAHVPIEVFHLSERGGRRVSVLDAAQLGARIGTIAIGE